MNIALRPALNLAIVGAWLALIYLSYKAALCVGGAALCIHGIVGAFRRKITVHGKFGPAKTYVGAAAVREGIFLAFVGFAFGLVAAAVFWLLPAWQP